MLLVLTVLHAAECSANTWFCSTASLSMQWLYKKML